MLCNYKYSFKIVPVGFEPSSYYINLTMSICFYIETYVISLLHKLWSSCQIQVVNSSVQYIKPSPFPFFPSRKKERKALEEKSKKKKKKD